MDVRRLLLISALLSFGAAAPASAGQTLAITPPPGPVAGGTVSVTLSGESESTFETLRLFAVPSATTCPDVLALLESSDPHYEDYDGLSKGPFSIEGNLEIGQPGAYLLCGFLGGVTTSTAMTVSPSAAEARSTAEAAEAQVKTAHEAEALQAQEVREQQIEKGPATLLRVKVVAHNGKTSSHPGHTTLVITTSPLVHVAVTFDHHARSHHYQASGNEPAVFEVEQGWSCGHPDLTYQYEVSAVGGSGAALRHSGRISTVSASRCAALRLAGQRRLEESHRRAEEEKREEESPKYKTEHAEDEYCERVLRGTAGVTQTVAGHMYTKCHISATDTHQAETIIVSESTIGRR
jgi:hypothetical protein